MIRMPYNRGKKLKVPVTFPTPLSKSRDYNAIEYLIYTIANYFYTESVESKNIHNPHRCREELLPMLADFYRYSYTDVKDVELERDIIATVPELHHNKGTVIGIDNALELSKVDKTSEIRIPWFYTKLTHTITVILARDVKIYKILELLRLVVPLGTKIVIKPGYFVQAAEEVQMHSWTQINVGPLDPNKQYYVEPNNFWHTVWDPEKQLYHTYVDEQWALGNPKDHGPHPTMYDYAKTEEEKRKFDEYNREIDGASRVGGIEIQGGDVHYSSDGNNDNKGSGIKKDL